MWGDGGMGSYGNEYTGLPIERESSICGDRVIHQQVYWDPKREREKCVSTARQSERPCDAWGRVRECDFYFLGHVLDD